MKTKFLRRAGFLVTVLACALLSEGRAQSDFQRVTSLESRMTAVEKNGTRMPEQGIVLVLFGTVCALWAQNTGRHPGLWFVLGVVGSVITVFVVLYKNAREHAHRGAIAPDSG